MKIQNLQRAKQIAEELPNLEHARKLLSKEEAYIIVSCNSDSVKLPSGINLNVINILNLTINSLKDEVQTL